MHGLHKKIKQAVRLRFLELARLLDRHIGTWLTPNLITWTGFAAHLPIAYLISQNHLLAAGLLLIFFGLFDTLDGALANVQGKTSPRGMFLDASTDRLQEVLLFSGFAVLFIQDGPVWAAALATFTCGLSLAVSYVKAKGEAALAAQSTVIDHTVLNRAFGDGIGSFEVRITLLVIGCLLGIPEFAILVVSGIALATLTSRMRDILRALA